MVRQINVAGIPFNVWGVGPYTLHQLESEPALWYISDVTGINTLSIHFDGLRAVLDINQAREAMRILEPFQPVPDVEEISNGKSSDTNDASKKEDDATS